jgi:5-formyltetrahydrofolate cyclo-ligase
LRGSSFRDSQDALGNQGTSDVADLDPAPASAKNVADEKKYVRGILRETRLALSHDWVLALSARIQERLLASEAYRECENLVLYAPIQNEVLTGGILAHALHAGRAVCFPRLQDGNSVPFLVRINDPAELKPGAFGIPEPTGAEIVPPEKLGRALICVPGVAFTQTGQRLGRGGGYYDRLLAAAPPQVVSAGLAYSFQVLDRLPESPHDRRLDLIITESALYAGSCAPRLLASEQDQGGKPRCG